MTEKLYDIDSNIKNFEAEVTGCFENDGSYKITLNKTAFFPEGGGQPADVGTIDGTTVLDVQTENGEIYHYLDKPLEVGSSVVGELDFDVRYDRMQNHSGEHIISGIVNSLYGYDNVGFHLSDETVTLDFDGELNAEQLSHVELLANKAVWSNYAIKAYYPDEAELEKLEYRSKKELDEAVRIVEIENCDRCACCAPHVKSTGEIGIIKFLDTEKMRGGTRIFIKCGVRALKDYGERYKEMLSVSNSLSVKQFEISDGVDKLYLQLNAQKTENTALKKRLISAMVSALTPQDTVVFEEGLDVRELQIFADSLYKKMGGIRAVFSPATEDSFSFAICGDADELDGIFAEFKKQFNVRGGGRNGMVQGTVIGEKEKIKLYFKN